MDTLTGILIVAIWIGILYVMCPSYIIDAIKKKIKLR